MNCRSLLILLGLSTLLALFACSKQSTATHTANLTGALSYRMPVSFATNAKLELQLTDVSISDGPAMQIANVVADLRALPYRYTLPYDPKRIDNSHRYTISARIYSADQLKYATDTAIAVLTQGYGAQVDIPLIAAGTNETTLIVTTANDTPADVFQGELRGVNEAAQYRAGFVDQHIAWLEEDRSNGTPPPLHARYEFKGALLLHYADSTGFEFHCNESGRPISASINRQAVAVPQAMTVINAARNRAALLRSHALSLREIQAHRIATKQDESMK